VFSPQVITRAVCGEFFVEGRLYTGNMPFEIQAWYAYCSDKGHCLVCCLLDHYEPEGDLISKLLPVPVRAVLRGFKIIRGYIVVDLPYSPETGLCTNPRDIEHYQM
jgi:hypothetical protein